MWVLLGLLQYLGALLAGCGWWVQGVQHDLAGTQALPWQHNLREQGRRYRQPGSTAQDTGKVRPQRVLARSGAAVWHQANACLLGTLWRPRDKSVTTNRTMPRENAFIL